jgi:hypothetical protein
MGDPQRIATAGNTEVPCYGALRELGFDVRRQERGGDEVWVAARAGVELSSASGLCALLGLATLREMRGEGWPSSDEEVSAFLRRFYDAV